MLGVSVFSGFNGALDTLVSQAIGAKEIEQCAINLQKARVINTLLFIPVFIGFYLSGWFMEKLGQDPEVTANAYTYIMCYAPGIYLMSLYDL